MRPTAKTHWRLALYAAVCVALGAARTAIAEGAAEWLVRMQPIIPKQYLCYYTSQPIVVDGNLDDPAWATAAWTSDFVDIEGDLKPAPRFHTHAKLVWDDNYLYIAAEIEEPHVWATFTQHDSVIFQDPDFEVFISPTGGTQPYYEFEMNALNTTWDLLLTKPYMDKGKPHNEWEIPGSKTAVRVQGTINNPSDTDKGWTVEIAFPWSVLGQHALHPGPPAEGEQWRLDFSRVEWQITTDGGIYRKVPHTREDNWVWSPIGVVDMHRPEMWGQLQFTRNSDNSEVTPVPAKAAHDAAMAVYYEEINFHKAKNDWASALPNLGLGSWAFSPQVTVNLQLTSNGYICSATENGHTWRVRQDRLLKMDSPLPVK